MKNNSGNPVIDNLMELGLHEMEANTLIRLVNKLKVPRSEDTYSEIENDPFWHEGGVDIETIFSLLKEQLPIVKTENYIKLEEGLKTVGDDFPAEMVKFELGHEECISILMDLDDERKEIIIINM
jgi:hypothetical protein